MLKGSSLILILLFTHFAWAGKVTSFKVKARPDLDFQIEGKVYLKSGMMQKTIKSINLSGLKDVLALNFDEELNVSSVEFSLHFRSTRHLKSEAWDLRIKGEMGPTSDYMTNQVLEIGGKATTLSLDCESIFQTSLKDKELVLDLTSFVSLASCTGADAVMMSPLSVGQRDVAHGMNIFSFKDEQRLGENFVQATLKDNADYLLPLDHPMTMYLQNKMEQIAKVSDLPKLAPQIRIINADVSNAFALPNGTIFVFRGLIDSVPSEAALMGALAHEWAHVAARHFTKMMTRTTKMMTTSLDLMASSKSYSVNNPEQLRQLMSSVLQATPSVANQLNVLHKGRDQEMEADRLGPQYAALAGFVPRGLGDMFEMLKRDTSTSLETYLTTRPNYDERIKQNHFLCALFFPPALSYPETSLEFSEQAEILKLTPMATSSQSRLIANNFVERLQQMEKLMIQKMAIEQLKNNAK